MAAVQDRTELMFVGKECHHSSCHLNDFLPFSCPACKQTFCQPHFLPGHHACTAPLPPSMVDRIAPQCPLCNQVVATTSGGPNEAVERHISSGTCVGLDGGEARRKQELKAKKERGEVCFRKGCAKNLVVQIKCTTCRHSFCPTHRHPSAHTCSPSATASGSAESSRTSTPQPKADSTRPTKPSIFPSSLPRPSPPSSTPAVAAKIAALKRAGHDVKAPFVQSKTDKRATAESNSQLEALKARHEKGLLTKTEELKYAEMLGSKESARRKGSKGKDDCVIC